MADDNRPVNDIATYVPPDRIIEKNTRCDNCVHWSTGPEQAALWRREPGVRMLVDKILADVHRTGLYFGDFDEGSCALHVAKLQGRGLSFEEAIEELNNQKFRAARALLPKGADPAFADKRFDKLRLITRSICDGQVGFCSGAGVDRNDQPLTPWSPVAGLYHCRAWTGKPGWSLDHEPGRQLDPLPAEMEEIIDSKTPKA